MKKTILLIAALLGAMVWSGCMKEELTPQEEAPQGTTWTVTVRAEKADGPQTKGLEIGDEFDDTLLKSIWKAGEEVKVYLDGACIGTLTATPDGLDAHKATLSGDITTTGITPNVTTLTLLTPRDTWDYTGQAGTLLDVAGSIEKTYHYTMASPVLVTGVSGNNITTEDASFLNQQSIYRLSFKYSSDVINAKSVTISGAAGELVQSQNVTGTTVTKGDISVTLGSATSDPFFVALRNGNAAAEVFTFRVVDNTGVTYRGTKTIPAAAKGNGQFVSMKNTTLPQRLDLVLSSTTEVTTAL
jgi:hypothetical protein